MHFVLLTIVSSCLELHSFMCQKRVGLQHVGEGVGSHVHKINGQKNHFINLRDNQCFIERGEEGYHPSLNPLPSRLLDLNSVHNVLI